MKILIFSGTFSFQMHRMPVCKIYIQRLNCETTKVVSFQTLLVKVFCFGDTYYVAAPSKPLLRSEA
jgi:hypothetical protein